MLVVFLDCSLFFFLRHGPSLSILASLASPVLKVQITLLFLALYTNTWGLNSGAHDGLAIAVPTELLTQVQTEDLKLNLFDLKS